MTKYILLAAVFLSGVCGFAQKQETPAAAGQASVTDQGIKSSERASQFAYLHVYRSRRYVGSALAPTISVDGTKVARVGSGRRFTARLTPGTHGIHSDDKSSAVTIDAVAGQHYYIRVDEETGFWKGHGKLTLLMPEQGKPEYQLQKPIEADRRLAKEMLEEDSETSTTPGKD